MLKGAVFLFATLLMGPGASLLRGEDVDFQREIRPLLSDRCFKCHGFDDESREADLGLHLFEEATRDLGGYQAVKPGAAAASELIARLISDDPDEVMPPAKANKPRFSAEEVDLMKRWIEEGAKYERHWAFEKPSRPVLRESEKGKHPVDQFLDRAIEKAGITAMARADPFTLIRRLSYDLRGIPPTVAEADAFYSASEKDATKAWADLIETFLASPAYGEKWAREWLDLARYADSNGYEKDRPRSIWLYRDWVVNALNADMPYDQFTIAQLAGDMLPNATIAQKVATGFHRNTMLNEEGGIDPLEFRFHAMVDRVATTGSVWMGLTTGCAQCHTHKFDPITHTDYFALMGLLNNADEPEIEVPDSAFEKANAAIDQQIDALYGKHVTSIDPKKKAAWIEEQKSRAAKAAQWTTLKPSSAKSETLLLSIEDDDSIYASGDFTKRDVYDLTFAAPSIEGEAVTAIRIEALPDVRLPARGPGVAYYEGRKGDFFLSEVSAQLGAEKWAFRDASVSFGKLSVGSGAADGGNLFDGDGSTGWSTSGREGQPNEVVINLETPAVLDGPLRIELLFERHFVAALGKLRVSVTTKSGEVIADKGRLPDLSALDEETNDQFYIAQAKGFADYRKKLKKLESQRPAPTTTLVMRERLPENPRETFRHHRGEYLQAKEKVSPAVPVVFEPIPKGQAKNRLGLARWLVSDRNPLVARVAVNRAWRSFFGTGILKTSGDFGYQSEQPTHPELLDWLAMEFVEQGMSFKSLHRLIVTSDAYQRSSAINSIALHADPENRLLARGPRFRLTGEMLRDGALQMAGLLSQKRGGPGVYPPQPEGVFELAYGGGKWTPSAGEDRYRRSLYTFVKRTAPFAAYLTFDGPTGESCIPRRDRSNTPLQALTLLNDAMFAEVAEEMASEAILSEGPNPVKAGIQQGPINDQRGVSPASRAIETIFRRILTRPPLRVELEELVAFYQSQIERLESETLKAAELLSDAERAAGAANEIAALKMVARVLLNLNENITRG